MNPYRSLLATRARQGMGATAAEIAAGGATTPSGDSSISAGQWLQASGQWAQALAGLTVGLFSADIQKKKNEQDAKLAGKIVGMQQQAISQPQQGAPAAQPLAATGGESAFGSTAVMLAIGAVALFAAVGKSKA